MAVRREEAQPKPTHFNPAKVALWINCSARLGDVLISSAWGRYAFEFYP